MSKHTPGDWHNFGPIIHVNGRHLAHVVCNGLHPDGDRGTPEERANAVLMARAPKLLKALRDLTEWGCTYTSPLDTNTPHNLLVVAREVLDEIDGPPCRHNAMVANDAADTAEYAWKCADCGHVHGKS